jgi:hypothetical protein
VYFAQTPQRAFCAQNGAVKETRLELEFKRYETHEDKIKRDIQTRGAIGIHHGGEGIRETNLASSFFTSKTGVLKCVHLSRHLDARNPLKHIRNG